MWSPIHLSILLSGALSVWAYFAWVRNGAYGTLDGIYGSEPAWLKRVRSILFWLWLGAGAILLVSAFVVGQVTVD